MTLKTTKEIRASLKAQVKELADQSRQLRHDKNEAKAAGDTQRCNDLHWERISEVRPCARALFIAYAYVKGRTYRQVEPKTREGNCPIEEGLCGYGYIMDWEGEDNADIKAWIEAETKTRFEIEPELAELAELEKTPLQEDPWVKVHTTPPAKGLLGRLRASLGI